MDLRAALDLLRAVAPELRARYGVVGARVFGSVARGDADPRSDIDVAVAFEEDRGPDVMRLCGVSGYLSGLFARDVDVIPLPTRDPDLQRLVAREAAIAFQRSPNPG